VSLVADAVGSGSGPGQEERDGQEGCDGASPMASDGQSSARLSPWMSPPGHHDENITIVTVP
jgi:hypothetical protein